MRHFKRVSLYCHLFATWTAASPVVVSTATTLKPMPNLVKRVAPDPSSYPYGEEHVNEMRWRGWNPQDIGTEHAEGQQLHDAYETMKDMVVLAWHEADANTPTFQRWFASSDSENVKNVLGRIVDMALPDPDYQPRMKDRVLERSDYDNLCGSADVNGYTSPIAGRHHICPAGHDKPNLAVMTCDDLDKPTRGDQSKRISSNKIRTVAGVMLHETVHWAQIGDAALGKHITDFAKGRRAFDCYLLQPEEKLTNAQNYAYLASEAYFQSKGCTFANPTGSVPLDEDSDTEWSIEDSPENGNSLSIAMTSSVSPQGGTASVNNMWKFYTTSVGKAVGSCGETDGQEVISQGPDSPILPSTADPENPPWPGGIFNLTIEGQSCQYKCDGTNPGRLFCPYKQISCSEDLTKSKKEGMLKCGSDNFFHAVVFCDF